MIPICAWKDVFKFNCYMMKSDIKNAGPIVQREKKSKKKKENNKPVEQQQVNIQVDLHVNKPEDKKSETKNPITTDKVVIDVEPNEIRPADEKPKEKEDPKEKMLKFESEPMVNGPDFSNADKAVINDPVPGVKYEEPKTEKEKLHEVTPEDLDEAIKTFNKDNSGNGKDKKKK